MHSADDLVRSLDDFNGHVDWHIDEVHGGYGEGQRNLEGRMLLEICLEKKLCMSNTWCMSVKKRKVTYRMGEKEEND